MAAQPSDNHPSDRQPSDRQPSDIEIANAAKLRPLAEIGELIGIPESALLHYGRTKAKIDLDFCAQAREHDRGKLILVTAMHPTAAGEGKTTLSIGLADALRRTGHNAAVCLREPSLGPVFGLKGGAAGGGYAQVVPMDEINLHFTGDFHAITTAHNLLASIIDNHLHQGNALRLNPHALTWGRVMDLSDRALRRVITGLGGRLNGMPRESGFDITPASEIMAIFCLSRSLEELRRRLGSIVIGEDQSGRPVQASELKADGAMTVLLKDALAPNLVQTLEGTPALVHGGPFANIAHGCNSLIATTTALGLTGYVVTEAGFGADLGAEKFFNIKCRVGGLKPDGVVIVATIRALKVHGGIAADDLAEPRPEAVLAGFANLRRHVENVRAFGPPVVVALNRFPADADSEIEALRRLCAEIAVPLAPSTAWARGGAGSEELAETLVEAIEKNPPGFNLTYEDDLPLWEKAGAIARDIYGADELEPIGRVRSQFNKLEAQGFGGLPVCMAKTQLSFSADPKQTGAPSGMRIPVRGVRLAAGAGYVVVLTGDVLTMPGLPPTPAAEAIGIDADGKVVGLF